MALTKIDGANIDGTISEITDLQNRSSISTNFEYKNRIINGAMRVNRRLNISGSPDNAYGYAPIADGTPRQLRLENWFVTGNSGDMIFSMGGGTDLVHTPLIRGIDNCLVIEPKTNSTATSAALNLITAIPGDRLLDMKFGESGTRYATLSWYMKTPVSGTMTVFFTNSGRGDISSGTLSLTQSDIDSGTYRLYHTSVSSLGNSWQRYSVTIPIDTSGTWSKREDEVGLQIGFNLSKRTAVPPSVPSYHNTSLTVDNWVDWSRTSGGSYGSTLYFFNNPEVSGQTNFTATAGTSYKIYITGVQFESGSSATDFETPPLDVEINALARRYFIPHNLGAVYEYPQFVYPEPMIGSRFTSGTETNPTALNAGGLSAVSPNGFTSAGVLTTTFCAYSFLWTDDVRSNHFSDD